MRQSQGIVQVERAAKRLDRLLRPAAPRGDHPHQQMGARLQIAQTQDPLGLHERFVVPAAMRVHAPE